MSAPTASEQPLASVDALIERMSEHLARFDAQRDRRAIFLRVYVLMTRRVRQRMAEGFFQDTAWMEQLLLQFAARYFRALDAFDAGQECPPAWRLAFETAGDRYSFVLENALLGINAHINNDLSQAVADLLTEAGDWPDSRRVLQRREDYDKINTILQELTPVVEEELAAHYARLLRLPGRFLGNFGEKLASFGLSVFRDGVWENAEMLLAPTVAAETEQVRGRIEQAALAIGKRIIQYAAPRWIRWAAPITRYFRLL